METVLQDDDAWRLLLAARAAAREGRLPKRCALVLDPDGRARWLEPEDPLATLVLDPAGWHATGRLSAEAERLFDLHLPLIRAAGQGGVILAQLGQSLDGRIATRSGQSHYVTGEANRDHLHRLRALVDAVVVGAGTVASDDPRLTVRRVEGPSPVRVVLDPRRRLCVRHHVFNDGAAPTLLVCGDDAPGPARQGGAEVLRIAAGADGFDPAALLHALHARGLRAVLVEGGGVTVSRFLAAGLLDRLHIAVAPLIIGSGRPGLVLPPIDDLGRALRPRTWVYPMGADTLFDCDLRAA